jgi:hypothetical protein
MDGFIAQEKAPAEVFDAREKDISVTFRSRARHEANYEIIPALKTSLVIISFLA